MAMAPLLPAYLIVGTDEVKRDAAIERLKGRLAASGMLDFNFDERDMRKDQEPDEVLSSLNTFPMGSDFRLVILRGCDRLPKHLSEPLVSYLEDPAPTTVALVVADSLAKNTRLYKALAKLGPKAVIDCAPKKRWELPKQVQGMARRYGRELSLSAAEALVARAGTSTRMLDNELKKLAAMVPGTQIDVEDVEHHVVRTAEVQPWDFLDALSARDLPRALELYGCLPAHSEVRIYSLMVTRIRELIVAKALDARGQGRELARALGVKDWQVKNHIRWARGFKMERLVGALREAVEVEQALKGSRDAGVAMTRWIAHIAG